MPVAASIRRLSRRDPTVRAIALAWRRLTGGVRPREGGCRRTLLACSGGADSSALVLSLASAIPQAKSLFVVAHIVHDLRPRTEALADRDAAAALAAALDLPFAHDEVHIPRPGGNAEAAARRLRYAALASLAAQLRCPFIATAHHADDQLETILMGLIRGSGLRGLAGVAAKRKLGSHPAPASLRSASNPSPEADTHLIRPCLTISRPELQRLCSDAGWSWREDATNADLSRLRAALRRRVLPILEELRPGAASRASQSAVLMADADGVVTERTAALLASADRSAPDQLSWASSTLRTQRPITLGGLLQSAAAELLAGERRDRLTGRIIAPALRAIRSSGTDPKRFHFSGIQVDITAHEVRVSRSEPPHGRRQ